MVDRATHATALQVVENLDRGGAQEVVRTLARHLPEYGWRPVVVTLRDGPLRADLEASGVPVEVIAGRRRSLVTSPTAFAELFRIRRELSDIAERHGASVVQTHLLRTLDFVALTLRRRNGVRAVLWTVHNALLELRPDQLPGGQGLLLGPKRVFHRGAYRFGGRMVDAFVAVSDDVADAIRREYRPPRARLAVIANGVDVDRYPAPVDRPRLIESLGLPPDARLLSVVAKLYRQKGHAVLLRALAASRLAPDVHVLLLGEGPERETLSTEVDRAGVSDRVHFLGNRSDVPAVLAASDLFVLPSLWEGLPMALLEAMASGLPVVATDVAGSRQVVVDGESGLLVPPGDAAALGAAIGRLLEDPVLAGNVGGAARERVVSSFSGAAQAARHAELYWRCLAARGVRER